MRLFTIALIALFGFGCGSKSDEAGPAGNGDAPGMDDGSDSDGADDSDGTTPADDTGTVTPPDDTAEADDTADPEDTAGGGDTADTGSDLGPDTDGDGSPDALDCNDTDPTIHPGADELCDDVDNDCDGDVDEAGATDAPTWYADTDGDTWGRESVAIQACTAPEGFVSTWGDCNDHSVEALPGGVEVCDGLDNDCDGDVDEGDATDALIWYADSDGDGFGDVSVEMPACDMPDGYVMDTTDCDDTVAVKYPGAPEVCDGYDNDCDTIVDEDDALDALPWYADGDGDGYGVAASAIISCDAPAGYAGEMGDCDDAQAAIHPTAAEVCDGVDNDCSGAIDGSDADDALTWYVDIDGDGYGLASASVLDCVQPEGYVADSTDCNDFSSVAHPDMDEVCDGIDNNCDGETDEDTAVDAPLWNRDTDTDGFGNPSREVTTCYVPVGHVGNALDCNDGDASINPDADEVCFDDTDNDCSGTADGGDAVDATMWFPDMDGDDFGDEFAGVSECVAPDGFITDGTDCDDDAIAVNPDADEIWYDDTDGDCSGGSDYDQDDDGVDHADWDGTDCDDEDEGLGSSDDDEDCDGVLTDEDCDDSDPAIGSPDVDGVCDGSGDESGGGEEGGGEEGGGEEGGGEEGGGEEGGGEEGGGEEAGGD